MKRNDEKISKLKNWYLKIIQFFIIKEKAVKNDVESMEKQMFLKNIRYLFKCKFFLQQKSKVFFLYILYI